MTFEAGKQGNFAQRAVFALVLTELIAASLLLLNAAVRHSPTLDEPAHLAAGVRIYERGDFGLYSVNPPLVRLIAALPLNFVGYKADWSGLDESTGTRSEFQVGQGFVGENGERSLWLFTLARWSCLPIHLFGGLISFLWARELWKSDWAGLIALTLWCFEPNILAHGELITTDLAATSFGLAAAYFFWRWLKRPTWGRAIVAGICLGLAELSKFVWIFLFGLWPLLAIFWAWLESRSRRQPASSTRDNSSAVDRVRFAAQLVCILGLAIDIINVGYGFDGTGRHLKNFNFVSRSLNGMEADDAIGNRFANSAFGNLPVPLPAQYVVGLDLQKRDLESHGPAAPSYLRGQWKQGGWSYYYVYGLLVKTTHGSQLLLLLAVALLFVRPRKELHTALGRDLVIVVAPAASLLLLVSSQLEFNQHVRYVLPVIGFACVFAGGAASISSLVLGRPFRMLSILFVLLAMFAHVMSVAHVYPHQLAYFNELAGGPSNGHGHLLHSNVDWGQSLIDVKKWHDQAPENRPLYLAYCGYLNPGDIGLADVLPLKLDPVGSPPPGWYVISKNLVFGSTELAYNGTYAKALLGDSIARAFANREPVASFGYAMNLYRVEAESQSNRPSASRLPASTLRP